jgi:hypothetical protein
MNRIRYPGTIGDYKSRFVFEIWEDIIPLRECMVFQLCQIAQVFILVVQIKDEFFFLEC